MQTAPTAYLPPFLLRSGHLSTIYFGLFRKVNGIVQKRERMELSDGDFIDLDWSSSSTPTSKLAIILHGLEGNAQRPYITGSAKLFNQNGFDACSVNLRGCSGEPNRLYRSYHSGATEDLIEIIEHVLQTKNYSQVYLKGFSLGGNLILKYLGEGNTVPQQIKGAVAISAPCSLSSSCEQLLSPKNILYARRFKKHLIGKLREKQPLFPDLILDSDISKIRTLKDFDDVYTSRAHGFKDAMDYYHKCSSLQFLPNINLPTLIINAKNDSFLGPECYPFQEAANNPHLHLEVPQYGGHVGFWGKNNITYTEKRALDFFCSSF
ncbi:YheT family hydrolase [Flagellimonas nanhaiensis]|uniref:Alpha/beta fold hydrolase n=1 Tax=Flagellimonas nanhaiensis TaxID=2292706 RepID=A0A371JQE1_9FLAO|nr:alpha/beta fold hydrolase [Allomuricauda nanhaiensis]RDY59643.1 alpha/beta fold hydrolase [Allomuricauda nanhaiensis]